MKRHLTAKYAFTLVELSIVLIVIGLLVGGILGGQQFIRVGEIRSILSQYQEFKAAASTFRVMHNNALPGDVRGQSNFGYVGDGNQDGTISDYANKAESNRFIENHNGRGQFNVHGGELVFFWNHLGSSGSQLIGGVYSGQDVSAFDDDLGVHLPQTETGSYWGVVPLRGKHYFLLGAAIAKRNSDYSTQAALSPKDAYQIDSKVDDGRPLKGIIQARGASATNPDALPSAGEGEGFCVDQRNNAITANYNRVQGDASEVISCTLIMLMQ